MIQVIQSKQFSVTRAGDGYNIHRILFDEKYAPEVLTPQELKFLQDPLDKIEKRNDMLEGDCVTINMITHIIESLDTRDKNHYCFEFRTECIEI